MALVPRERHPVVAGDHHDRVGRLAGLVENLERRRHVAVESLHLEEIVGEVVANQIAVGQVGRHTDLRRIEARLRATALGVGPMRIARPEPKAKGLTCGPGGEKLAKPFAHWLARGVPRAAERLPVAGAPGLAPVAHVVARVFEQERVDGVFGSERTPQVHPGPEPPVHLPGEDRVAGRRARGGSDEGVLEQHPFAGHAVEAGRLYDRVAVGRGVGPAPVVGDAEQDVGPRGGACDVAPPLRRSRGRKRTGRPQPSQGHDWQQDGDRLTAASLRHGGHCRQHALGQDKLAIYRVCPSLSAPDGVDGWRWGGLSRAKPATLGRSNAIAFPPAAVFSPGSIVPCPSGGEP